MSLPTPLVLLLALVAASCARGTAADHTTVVFASASLAAPFDELARAFERAQPGHEVRLNTAGTPQLVLQAREGARVDVFASADAQSLVSLLGPHDDEIDPIDFALNRMAIAVAAGNPRGIKGLSDLERDDLLVALCGPAVPAGRYARSLLEAAAVQVRSSSDEPSVRALVSKVALGELDAGLVYASDLVGTDAAVEAVTIPTPQNVVARYPVAILARGEREGRARAFVDFLLSEAGGAILTAHGFELP
ncbi:molybdate ABC transporter substrate-binding protein [Engelhardtia mirabilis]|uniref:Molybdate-binding periplasmic protein n=1 Tax=Engelhardtia mirabilis TaxID=2528011 RepID=A0A518BMA9_9BACT|nr:Molybdate-binding periplasmic protein precursor [Planctomycetes bacterium Pla133]QDV02444.1 Molybdate-binding periplasmic protein precursor [Planctomycetes bacterium Pla86]